MQRLHSSTPTRRWLIGLALSALLATQWLAVLHGLGHLRLRGPAEAQRLPAAALAQGVLKFATGHDEGSPVCQWLDQLANGTPLAFQPATLAEAAPDQAWASPPLAASPAAAAAPYSARAPPFLA
jgi:hypothetical protein